MLLKFVNLKWLGLFSNSGEEKIQRIIGKITGVAKLKLFQICSRASQLLKWALSGVDAADINRTHEVAVEHGKVGKFREYYYLFKWEAPDSAQNRTIRNGIIPKFLPFMYQMNSFFLEAKKSIDAFNGIFGGKAV